MLHLALPPTPPIVVITLQSENVFDQHLDDKNLNFIKQQKGTVAASENGGNATSAKAQNLDAVGEEIQYQNSTRGITTTSNNEKFPPEFSTGNPANTDLTLSSEVVNSTDEVVAEVPSVSKNADQSANELVAEVPAGSKNVNQPADEVVAEVPSVSKNSNQPAENSSNSAVSSLEAGTKSSSDLKPTENNNSSPVPASPDSSTITQNIKAVDGNFLVGVIINRREVGSLDIRIDGNSIVVPLGAFAEIADFTVENIDGKTRLKTPLGVVDLLASNLKEIDGITYLSEATLKEKLSILLKFDSANLALVVDLPWRRGSGESQQTASALQPEVLAPISGLSSLRQELQITNSSGDTRFRSSTLLGGRLAGGNWRVRLNNNFVNQPDISEYFFYKRSNQLRYQVGRQQIGLHPLLNGMNLTGAQIGYSNLPADRFRQQYSASELLPRRSQPLQSFRGEVPPASFVQLRVSGIIVAQQQVGLNGIYEFIDVNLPTGNNNDIELLIFDRNNINIPVEIRSLRINASDLLLPAGGNVQLGGLGLSGNLAQDSLFGDFGSESGKLVGFYQLRQGLSENLTFEGSVQSIPGTVQTQAGFIWRLANPAVLATSLGTSRGQVGYTTDLDINFGKLEILGNSQLFPTGYNSSSQSRDRFNHSLETNYKFSNNFKLGFIARSRQDESRNASYIIPTFTLNPFNNLSLRGRPDLDGRYLFSSYYYPSRATRLAFNTFGDIYTSDITHNLNRNYQFSLGGEFGGDLEPRYSTTLNYNSRNISGLSWRVGLAYSDGDVGPIVGASMQVLPGLFARAEYQGIPSRSRSLLGGFGDDRLTVLLVSDLSFAGGGVAPASSYGLGQEKGGISGQIVVEGGKKDFNLGGANIRVLDSRNNRVGTAKTDSAGNFFVGNLREGIYIVELDPDRLPIELAVGKTTIVAEVAGAAITRLSFAVTEEYGLAGRITDVAGKPMTEVRVELINPAGARVLSTMTDQFGLYRLDGVPIGNYTLRVPSQDGITNSETLPKLEVAINKDFVYDQNLQLPITAAAKDTKEK
ncbi:carboxypeptidase regulatory-like domain-containing protein [Dendronalium sp. ChiSLP03b]|uniref:carboxypeptidase regulatory-like domain-containing protein n=1 Tax=Dendronalium sp. ChiSLP03b TaxID=3075381 RepID=UPI002AD51D0F|nr:carboxypeptidase regulatory-like domain-containing protein [Dendronalium sp. ChiSLP03b]MDZ8206861.1 carboxypeptidase regulatory-like domain-containing protein [Dendronalium sp. ChiSLP03b]